MPEQEPLAGLLHVCLAVAAEDLRHLRLDLAQRDLQPRLAAVPQPVDKLVIPCNYGRSHHRIGKIIICALLSSFNLTWTGMGE